MDKLQSLLKDIYPNSFHKIVDRVNSLTPQSNKTTRTKEWYKSLNLYVTYPDSFEINGVRDLKSLTQKLEYIRSLGFNAIHILPFLDSPFIDGGFDVKDYKNVRGELGGIEALDELIAKANQLGVHIFMDLIMNHISDQHEWFQKAINGDGRYREYSLHFENKPTLLEKYSDSEGHWAHYDFGTFKQKIRIIFPQFEKELPHFIQGKDGKWYYHTFYQYQPDLNWYTPEVFIEFIEIMKFWSDKGMNFRLDAITFMGKDLERGSIESNPNLHKIIQALNYVLESISPGSVFLAETCQPVEVIKKYFGSDSEPESEIAYNFRMMQSVWFSYLKGDGSEVKKTLNMNYSEIPSHATWVNFLRNHDELTLEYIDEDIRDYVYNTLLTRGRGFRDGFGVAGRTFDFVGNSSDDLLFLYKVLASLPGISALVYGDELGKRNDPEYSLAQVKYKKEVLGLVDASEDTRDINRGVIKEEDFVDNKLISEISNIFNRRLELTDYFKTIPLSNFENNILVLEYKLEKNQLRIEIDFRNKRCDWNEIE